MSKRARITEPGSAQLLLVKPELQAWTGKKYCDETELLSLLFAHSIVRRVRTIEVEVRPLGGDSFKILLDTRKPLVSEAKVEIARVQGVRETRQELFKAAMRADGKAVREDDVEPEVLRDDDMNLQNGDVVAMAVKDNIFEPLNAHEEHTMRGHDGEVLCLLVHGHTLFSGSSDHTRTHAHTHTCTRVRTRMRAYTTPPPHTHAQTIWRWKTQSSAK